MRPQPCSGFATAALTAAAFLSGNDTRAAQAPGVWEVRTRLDQRQCLDVMDQSRRDGARVQLWPCSQGSNQAWTFDGQAVRVYGNMCLDVVDGQRANGVPLQVWGCAAPNANQRFERFGNMLRWVGSPLCLDVPDGRAQNGAPLQLWRCDGNNRNQAFAFVERDAVAPSPTPKPSKPKPGTATSSAAAPAPAAAATKLQSAGKFLGFPYIALATFLNKHPVLKPLRQDIIDAAASVTPALPPILLAAIAMEESSGNPTVAGGLMQFTWAPTWAYYGRGNILNGRDSLFAGARYMTALLQEQDNDLAAALRAYNGDANKNYVAEIKSWLSGGFPYGAGT